MTECIVAQKHKNTLYSHIYAWPWQQRTRYMMNWVCGPIQPQFISFSNAHVEG
ncbi:unnamed protein product [Staurois parvus]|uniref:Uncharacterized protein n=1 Tax=Staurois parvus TaxID=386267 RepID=A0ABN9EJT2_9NEOB|nr:unnamed protein product [Staurois parvus]